MPSTDVRIDPAPGVPLAPFCTLGVGGSARWFVRATSAQAVEAAHEWASDRGLPLFVLGGGSNLVIADAGIEALVVHIGLTGVEVATDAGDTIVTAAAGEPWDALVADLVSRGLAGVECLSGIPGSVGGTPIQNVGAYGQDVGHVIDAVSAFDRQAGTMVRIGTSDCGFAYRQSRFKRDDAVRFVVCGVTFRLRPGPPNLTYPDIVAEFSASGVGESDLGRARHAVLAVRQRKGMVLDATDVDTHSVGSFFVNPIVSESTYDRVAAHVPGGRVPRFVMPNGDVKIPAAWLIETAGFSKGHGDGPVGVSSKHSLALVNRGGATARDVVALAARIKRAVIDRFGIALRAEPMCVGFTDDPDVEFLAG